MKVLEKACEWYGLESGRESSVVNWPEKQTFHSGDVLLFFVRSGISLSNREKKVKKGNYCHFYRLKQRRLIGVWRSKVEFKISFSFITSIMWRCFFVFFYLLLLLLLILFLFPTDSIGIINIWLIFFSIWLLFSILSSNYQ